MTQKLLYSFTYSMNTASSLEITNDNEETVTVKIIAKKQSEKSSQWLYSRLHFPTHLHSLGSKGQMKRERTR